MSFIDDVKRRLERAKTLRKEHNENVGARQDGPRFDTRAAQAELDLLNNAPTDIAKLLKLVHVYEEALNNIANHKQTSADSVYLIHQCEGFREAGRYALTEGAHIKGDKL